MQVIGKLEEVHDVVKRTETFSVREFVLEIGSPGSQYTEHVLFQLSNRNVDLINQFQIGQEITVDFDLRGRKWMSPDNRTVFFNTLNAWRITPYSGQQAGMGGMNGGYGMPQQGGYGMPQQPQQPMSYGMPQQGGYGMPQQPQQPMGYGTPQQPQQMPQQPMQQPGAPAAAPDLNAGADGGDDMPF